MIFKSILSPKQTIQLSSGTKARANGGFLIVDDKKDKIFETFFQVDSTADTKFGGAGLGLSISRGIVMAHGGKIWVSSKVGEGSTFKFTIPINSVVDIEDRFKKIDVFRIKKDVK